MGRSALSYSVVVLVLSLTAGCTASLPGAGQGRPEQTLLTRKQIEDPRFSSAYDVVRALRGNWLTARGVASLRLMTDVQVYLDGVPLGGAQVLRGISTPSIQYIRYYNGTDATTRWGVGHGGGVIFVGTGRTPGPGAPPP
ncbi:MAG: hypothetical protein C0497_15320 [Gemmatimonas sp.]|nr:hypothetical protein [Gemmatimonas sp.]